MLMCTLSVVGCRELLSGIGDVPEPNVVPQTIEVPATVIVWQTIEVPVKIIEVQTVQVPVIVEVTRVVTVTPEVSTAPPTVAPTPAIARATAIPPRPAPPAASPTPHGPDPATTAYLLVAKAQNESLFIAMNDMRTLRRANAASILTSVSARVASVRAMLNISPPPPGLAHAHQLMLTACERIDQAVALGWRNEPILPALDRAYEANIEAERLLNAAAGPPAPPSG